MDFKLVDSTAVSWALSSAGDHVRVLTSGLYVRANVWTVSIQNVRDLRKRTNTMVVYSFKLPNYTSTE